MDRWEGNMLDRSHRGRSLGTSITLVILGIAIGTALLGYIAFASTNTNVTTVQQVILVFRHGDRTPTETYPNDPYLNYDWPGGWGALTKEGMFQMYKVGQWIRKEYGLIIGKMYKSDMMLVQSSYADRCIMSAQTLLAGLYPPQPDEMFLPGLAWRPVPVHAIPRNLDKVIAVKAPCPRLDEALREAYANESARSDAILTEYYNELSEYTGKDTRTITDVEFLYNTLEIEEQHGLKLPEWTKKFYDSRMREIAARSLALFTSNRLQQRLRGGSLLKEIVERLRAAKDGSDRRRAYLYSAHDITLVNLLRTMGFTNELFKPEYGAMLIFELHTVDYTEDAEVKVFFLNSTRTNVAHRMKVPKCDPPCLFGNLVDLWKDVIPENWDDECRL